MNKLKGNKKLMLTLKIILAVIAAIVLCYGAIVAVSEIIIKNSTSKIEIKPESWAGDSGLDRIHFLSTASSDAILIESNGHFALVDCAEDSEYPADKPALDYKGYEEEVLAYLKKVAADENGNVVLDFVLGTHAHSDHIGGFDTVINDPQVTVNKAYLRKYDSSKIRDMELEKWDNQEVYDQMYNALAAKNVEIIEELGNVEFDFQDFHIKFINGEEKSFDKKVGENTFSVGCKITKGEKTVFLAADMDNFNGDEKNNAPQIGKVDLLKVGHHGYAGSTSFGFAKALKPEIVVQTNKSTKAMTRNVKFNLALASRSALFATGEHSGIIATFTDANEIILTNEIM